MILYCLDCVFILNPINPSQIQKIKLKKGSKILLFDWIRRCLICNFFIVTNSEIQLLQLNESTFTAKKIFGVSKTVNNAWFNSKKQQLFINFKAKPLEFKLFNLNNLEEGINFKYPDNDVILQPKILRGQQMMVYSTNSYQDKSNSTINEQDILTHCKIDFLSFYGATYLLVVNTVEGKLLFFDIETGKMQSVNILSECKNIFINRYGKIQRC